VRFFGVCGAAAAAAAAVQNNNDEYHSSPTQTRKQHNRYAFDTVKVRLQTGRFGGMLHCFRHIVATEGVRGLYKGLTPPLIGGAVETGINYAVYTRLLRLLDSPAQHSGASGGQQPSQQQQQQSQQQHRAPPLSIVPVAGAGAGAALSLVLAPVELLKCRLQTEALQREGGGPLAALRRLLAEEGARGLARGLGATMLREVPGNAIYFTTYEWLRRGPWALEWAARRPSDSSSSGSSGKGGSKPSLRDAARDAASAVLCGGLAGVVMWTAVLPLDAAKSRIQVARPGTPWDVGVARHLKVLWAEGRSRALWAGLAPTLARAFPANAVQWLTYEAVVRQLSAD
jgi:hypothetical protein